MRIRAGQRERGRERGRGGGRLASTPKCSCRGGESPAWHVLSARTEQATRGWR